MNILIFGDIHICLSALEECTLIFDEIINLVSKYNVNQIISLGDNFDNTKPSALELNCLANFIKKLNNRKIILLSAQSHESLTTELSSLDHYGILSDNVQIVKEYKDGNHLLCIHDSVKESPINFDAKHSYQEYKDFIYVFAGHIHSYYILKPNFCGLGSCRFVSFTEANDKHKVVAIISDYGTDKEQVHFLKLKSPISMLELQLGRKEEKSPILPIDNDGQGQDKGKESGISGVKQPILRSLTEITTLLDKTDPNTKVKVKILDFESFRQFLPLCSKYSTKFETFKYETYFDVIKDLAPNSVKKEIINFKESLMIWLRNQKIDETIKEILQKEIE